MAALVARGVSQAELLAAVVREVGELFGVDGVTISRYAGDDTVILAGGEDSGFPVGTAWPVTGDNLAARARDTGRPARIDDYEGLPGTTAAAMRSSPWRAAVGVPILVEGELWGLLCIGAPTPEALPTDTEQRIAHFTELVAAAIANSESRERLGRIAVEQAALRRVATLVAEGVDNEQLFDVVAEEVGRVVGVPDVTLDRYEPDGSASVVLASWRFDGAPVWPVGSRWPLDGPSVAKTVWETGRPWAMNDYPNHTGSIAEHYHQRPKAIGVGVPILVDGRVWGVVCVGSTQGEEIPADSEERLVGFTELLATAIGNTAARDHVRALLEEQAALRRVATLVAEGAPAGELFSAVADEVRHVLDVPGVSLDRYGDGVTTVVAASGEVPFVVGSSWPVEPGTVAARVLETGRPARLNNYAGVGGDVADTLRGLYPDACIVGAPVVVDGRVWGMMGVGTPAPDSLPDDTEARLSGFTELIATAISNTDARDSLRVLADEQAALRRVATLVAEGATLAEVCSAVAKEVSQLLSIPEVTVDRYDDDSSSTVLAEWGSGPFRVGSRWPIDPGTASHEVFTTGRPARLDRTSYADVQGPIGEALRKLEVSCVAVPIMVDGKVWGIMGAASTDGERLPAGTEDRLAGFTELVATAISNADARDGLRVLADEQASLRRVATLVAQGARGTELYSAVAREIAQVLDIEGVTIDRYDGGRATTVLAAWYSGGRRDYEVGTRWSLDGPSVAARVLETARPARIDDYGSLEGTIAAELRKAPHATSVGVPIIVDGVIWGIVCAGRKLMPGALPADTETRLARFTDLVATAISNADARDSVRLLADEQAALHRVAALVARGASAQTVFDAVCAETGPLVDAASINLSRYTGDGMNVTMAGWSLRDLHVPVGTRFPITPDTIAGAILSTKAPARVDSWLDATSELGRLVRERGIRSSVGAPVVVQGRIWGALVAASDREEPLSSSTEARLGSFTELIATTISNATTRTELISSRARIVAAGDEARRRIERNLHDGVQQRVVALGLDIQTLRATLPLGSSSAEQGFDNLEVEVEALLEDIREVSRGVHPALLARAGLGPSLGELARRSPIPVSLSVDVPARPPETIEICIYYVVSEALTNAIKHSGADAVDVSVTVDGSELRAFVADNGAGGAAVGAGSGLTGLVDRVEALGGRMDLHSAAGEGTRLEIELPLRPA